MEKELIQTAYKHIRDQKTLYTLIDEAHLRDMNTLRKLRLLFDTFPPKHNLILFGQPKLLHHLAMQVNADLKSRITYSVNLLPLNDYDLEQFIQRELEIVKLGINTFDEGAIEVILLNTRVTYDCAVTCVMAAWSKRVGKLISCPIARTQKKNPDPKIRALIYGKG
ncbi:MAG: hypothetical protein P8X74_14005 [Reinekea sp.]